MKSTNGFSLIELMIVVMIVGVLMAIALPSYKDYVLRSHRADAQSSLIDIAARQERFVAQRNTYTTEVIAVTGLNMGLDTTPEGYYTLSVLPGACGDIALCYAITAIATGSQAADTECATITYDHLGTKGPAGTDCW